MKLFLCLLVLTLALPVQEAFAVKPTQEDTYNITNVRVVGSGQSPVNYKWDVQMIAWGSDGSGGYRPTGITYKLGGATVSSVVITYDSNGNASTFAWTLH